MSFREEIRAEASKTNEARLTEEKKKFEAVSHQCLAIASSLKDDVRKEAAGKFDNHIGFSLGYIKYRIRQANDEEGLFFASDKKSIEDTAGFQTLVKLCEELGLAASIEEDESDAVEDTEGIAPDLYHLDITVFGWA